LLGIELGNDGVTLNDSLGHTGPNHFQNFPFILGAAWQANMVVLGFPLDGTPNQTYRIEFFLNDTADPSGFGQGGQFLGATTVFAPASGHVFANAQFVGGVVGQLVTATATDEAGNTSEFSADVTVERFP
jgi:hypothetical protein